MDGTGAASHGVLGAGETIALLLFALIASCLPYGVGLASLTRSLLGLAVIYFWMDACLANTSIAFITRSPVHPLRSILLTLMTYGNLGLAFAVLHLLQKRSYASDGELTLLQALYFSFVTQLTVGYGDIYPNRDQPLALLTVLLQILVALYFIVVIIGVLTSWAPGPNKGKPS